MKNSKLILSAVIALVLITGAGIAWGANDYRGTLLNNRLNNIKTSGINQVK